MPRGGRRNLDSSWNELRRSLGSSELVSAVSRGNFQTVRSLIKSGADLNCPESNGETPIYAAIGAKNSQMIEELIRAGADPNFRNDKPGELRLFFATPLFFATWGGDLEDIEALLNNGANIHGKESEDEWTALHFSASLGLVEKSAFLIEHGLNVDSRNIYDQTPLHTATRCGKAQIVELLIARGADISATCTVGNNRKVSLNVTAVFMAVVQRRREIFNILVKAGADVNVKTSGNFTALHVVAEKGTPEWLNLLLAAGAERSINVRSEIKKWTPLLYAAVTGRTNIVEALLKVKGIEVDAASASMETPLFVAARNGHLSVVELLVASGASINVRGSDMMTPLHVALAAKQEAVAELLVQWGADVHAADKTNATPLHIACKNGVALSTIKMLVEEGADLNARTNDNTTPLLYAIKGDHLKIVKLLLYHEADCNISNKENCTALHIAASHGSVKIVKYLVSKVSNIDAKSLSEATPLHYAVEKGHREVVDLLLKSNANVNAQDVTKRTPLHIAAEKGLLEIAESLLRHNAHVNLKEEHGGCTPLFLAVKHNHESLVSLLLDKGAHVNAANNFGVLPIHVAVKAENVDVVKALLTKGAYYGVEVTSEDYSGTPIKFARKAKNAKIIVILEIIRKLFKAVIKNDTDQIVLCVQAGAILDAKKSNGQTALHYTISNCNGDAVKALLGNGADILLATDKGDLPLHIALATGSTNIPEIILAHVKKLSFVKHNFIVNAKTVEGGTMLHTAAEKNELHIVKFLLANGAVYNAKNSAGKMPVELTTDEAIKGLLISAEKLFKAVKAKDGLEEVLRIAANDKSAVNAREADSGATPLYWSILRGHIEIALSLLSFGADYCLVTDDGTTPLHTAASEGNVEIVEALVNRAKNDSTTKANNFINAVTLSRTAALHVASNSEVVKCLLKAGAMYDIRNGKEKTALELARCGDVRKLLKTTHQLFEDVGKRVFVVMNVLNVLNGLELEEFLAVTSTRNAQGQTLVQLARARGHVKIANKVQEKLKKFG